MVSRKRAGFEPAETGHRPVGAVRPLIVGQGRGTGNYPPPPPPSKAVFLCLCLVAGFAAGCRAIGIEDKNNPFDETAPVLSGFPLSTQQLVFFTEKGSLTLSAQLEPEVAMIADIAWSVGDEGVATVVADGANVTVSPAGAGKTVVRATLSAKEGYAFDENSELSSECAVTVLDSFTIKPASGAEKVLFFAGEAATDTIEVELNSMELTALSQVADILWEKTGSGVSLAAGSSGANAAVGAGSSGEEAQVSARLAVKAGSEAFFNGNDTYTAPVTVKTFAVPAPVISGAAGEKMLGASGPSTFSLSMSYPAALGEFAPQAVWTSSAANVAAVAGGTLSNGSAGAALTAKAVGTASIGASLNVAGRSFPAAAQTVSVVVYTPPTWDAQSIDITGAVSGGSLLALTDTTTSGVITAAAKRSDSNQPSNMNIIWETNDTGNKIRIVPEASSNPTGGKIKIEALDKTASNVTVTAKSASNPGVVKTFTVKVDPIAVTITGSPATTLVYNNGLAMNASSSLGAIKWSVIDGSDKAQVSAAEGASTTVTARGIVTANEPIKVRAASKLKDSYYAEHSFTLKPHTFTISFNANNGGGSMTAQTATYGSGTEKITANTFTRTGWTFGGWLETAEGTDVIAADKAAVSVLNAKSEAKKPAGGNLTLYAKWTPNTYPVSYVKNGGGNSMTDDVVAHGTVYTIKANGFSAPGGKAFKEWDVSGAGVKQPGDTITVTGAVTITAQWFTLGEIASGQGNTQDLMIKFGVKPAGYTTATAEDVRLTFLSAQAYTRSAASVTGANTANAKLGVVALGDYVDLPQLQVAEYKTTGGNFNKTKLRVQVVGVNSYVGKNNNGNDKHLVFQFKDIPVKRRMHSLFGGGTYDETEVRRYLTPISGDSDSGKFLAGLEAAGVPRAVLWAPVRKIGGNEPFIEVGGGVTVTDLVYLPSFWEIHNWDTYGSGPSKPVSNENAENSAWLSYYSPAGNPSSWSIFGGDEQAAKAIRTKKAAGTTTNESWWLASARAGYQGGYFNSIESTGNTYYWGQEENLGIIPVFCVK